MLKNSLFLAWRSMGKLGRFALELALLLAIAGALVLLTLRYRILPDIERYHEQITAAASAAIGQPLTIGRIEADWDGLRPRLLLSDVQDTGQAGPRRTEFAAPGKYGGLDELAHGGVAIL